MGRVRDGFVRCCWACLGCGTNLKPQIVILVLSSVAAAMGGVSPKAHSSTDRCRQQFASSYIHSCVSHHCRSNSCGECGGAAPSHVKHRSAPPSLSLLQDVVSDLCSTPLQSNSCGACDGASLSHVKHRFVPISSLLYLCSTPLQK